MKIHYKMPQVVPTDSRTVLDMPLDDGFMSGVLVQDRSQSVNHGTAVNAPVPSYPGFLFNGTDNYVDVPYSSVLDNPAAFSITVWAMSSQAGSVYADNGMIVDMGNLAPSGHGIYIDPVTDKVTTYYNSNASLACDSVLDTDWHFYAETYDGTTLRLYRDSAEQGSGATVAVGTIDDNPLRIGAQSKSVARFWKGPISDVRLYNRCLTANKTLAHYNLQRGKYGV